MREPGKMWATVSVLRVREDLHKVRVEFVHDAGGHTSSAPRVCVTQGAVAASAGAATSAADRAREALAVLGIEVREPARAGRREPTTA